MHVFIHLARTRDQKRIWYKATVEYLNPDYSSHWLMTVQKLGVDSEEDFRAEVRRKLKLLGATRIKFGAVTRTVE